MDSEPRSENDITNQSNVRPKSSRRTFIQRLLASLAIGVPAFRILTETPNAHADNCAEAVCETVYLVYRGHNCGARENCPSGTRNNCVGYYDAYCTCSGQYCWSISDTECTRCCDAN